MEHLKKEERFKELSAVSTRAHKGFLLPALMVMIFLGSLSYYFSQETITILIQGKERITTGGGENISSKFMVYADSEVFENTDSVLFLKFNSADYQNKLLVGNTYDVKVVGWRVPLLSWYRNIVEIY
jgi:hypothetical protein